MESKTSSHPIASRNISTAFIYTAIFQTTRKVRNKDNSGIWRTGARNKWHFLGDQTKKHLQHEWIRTFVHMSPSSYLFEIKRGSLQYPCSSLLETQTVHLNGDDCKQWRKPCFTSALHWYVRVPSLFTWLLTQPSLWIVLEPVKWLDGLCRIWSVDKRVVNWCSESVLETIALTDG